jgi:hypothetical protein
MPPRIVRAPRRPEQTVVLASRFVPQGSLIEGALGRIDYADTYTIAVDPRHTLDTLAYGVFGTLPRWVRHLLSLRDRLMKPLGLVTRAERPASELEAALVPGACLGFFPVLKRGADELLLGENDRHLDFRVGIIRTQQRGGTWLSVTTAVQFHGWPGHLYFVPVRPFHALIMQRLMRAAATRLGPC